MQNAMRIKLIIGKSEPLPEGIKSISGVDPEEPETYFLLVAPELSPEEQESAFLHEMLHIWRGDHLSALDVNQIESKCHHDNGAVLH